MKIRIETGNGWYPNPGMTIDRGGDDFVIESVEPDPDALFRIGVPTRHTIPLSVIATVRPATPGESQASHALEEADVDEWLGTMAKR